MEAIQSVKPDVVVTIDSKGFNFRLLSRLKRKLSKSLPNFPQIRFRRCNTCNCSLSWANFRLGF